MVEAAIDRKKRTGEKDGFDPRGSPSREQWETTFSLPICAQTD